MSNTATMVDALEKTVHKTNEWLKDVEMELDRDDRHFAYQTLRAVLHVLRDRLPVQEAANFGSQLPTLIRGIYYEGWNPARMPNKDRKMEEFTNRILEYFPNGEVLDPEFLIRSVFKVIKKRISAGEIMDIWSNFPDELLPLWN
jgi:uncharacterized protein (DUF2267 family)